jgi:hypothetical protein
MNCWIVTVTYPGKLDPKVTSYLADALLDRDGLAANLPDFRFSVAATSHLAGEKAAEDVVGVVHDALFSCGFCDAEPISIEAVECGEYDRRAEEPTYPELMSAGEVAEELKISRQRVHQLAAENSGFPAPLYELAIGKLWSAHAIRGFDRTWTRKPGRRSLRAV